MIEEKIPKMAAEALTFTEPYWKDINQSDPRRYFENVFGHSIEI